MDDPVVAFVGADVEGQVVVMAVLGRGQSVLECVLFCNQPGLQAFPIVASEHKAACEMLRRYSMKAFTAALTDAEEA